MRLKLLRERCLMCPEFGKDAGYVSHAILETYSSVHLEGL
jgi:hypothetical protein